MGIELYNRVVAGHGGGMFGGSLIIVYVAHYWDTINYMVDIENQSFLLYRGEDLDKRQLNMSSIIISSPP